MVEVVEVVVTTPALYVAPVEPLHLGVKAVMVAMEIIPLQRKTAQFPAVGEVVPT
jgi:hypothetical protein